MSINGSGRFSRRKDSELSSGSLHSNFSAAPVHQQHEPGTGAAFMAQSGWSQRDAYGRPRADTGGGGGLFAPAAAIGKSAPLPPVRASTHPQHNIKFQAGRDRKSVYLVCLIVVSLLLLTLLLLVVLLLVTKVYVPNAVPAISLDTPFHNATSPAPAVEGSNGARSLVPLVPLVPVAPAPLPIAPAPPPVAPAPQIPPPHPIPTPAPPVLQPGTDRLQTRSFDCEFYIMEQANEAYRDTASFEYNEAMQIIYRALTLMIDGSTLRDMSPSLSVEHLENTDGGDLRVLFRLSVVVLSQSSIRADAIRNVLLSELIALESLLNHTVVDRRRIAVRMVVNGAASGTAPAQVNGAAQANTGLLGAAARSPANEASAANPPPANVQH